MGKKGSHLGRVIVLDLNELIDAKGNVNSDLDKQQKDSLKILLKNYGQIKPILVRKLKKGHQVVDGQKMLSDLRKSGATEALCINLGSLDDHEYIFTRLALNIHRQRIDYLRVAELVSEVNNEGFNITSISTKLGLSRADAERYAELLDFDWDDFNKRTNELQYEKLF